MFCPKRYRRIEEGKIKSTYDIRKDNMAERSRTKRQRKLA